MIYLTYNDQPSGVFSSQVNDVCNFLNHSLNAKIKLVAIISLRNFFQNRNKIKKEVADAWVLPALPTAKYWKISCWIFSLICLLTGEKIIISRNVLATKIALFSKKLGVVNKVCLDGRGAIAAEWAEYAVVSYDTFKDGIAAWEKAAVLGCDYRIAVSQKLVDWWRSAYGYQSDDHVVIPCTLQSTFQLKLIEDQEILEIRKKEGFNSQDIIMVYSGSTSGWQSFNVLETFLGNILSESPIYKMVFLSKDDPTINKMKNKYPGQVFNTWLEYNNVKSYLSMCDFGILYREQSITNKVSAPTKFAEYLSAGLPVIISENIGDYSDFVKKYGCGIVINNSTKPEIKQNNPGNRAAMVQLAQEHFTKPANMNLYQKMLTALNLNH